MQIDDEIRQLRGMLQGVKDRQDILDCLTREARGRDRHDAELTASCYWEDGADEHGLSITPGPLYGEKANFGHRAAFSGNSHNLTNHACQVDGDVAFCETYVMGGLLSLDEKTCKIALGRYIDQLERRDGQWTATYGHRYVHGGRCLLAAYTGDVRIPQGRKVQGGSVIPAAGPGERR